MNNSIKLFNILKFILFYSFATIFLSPFIFIAAFLMFIAEALILTLFSSESIITSYYGHLFIINMSVFALFVWVHEYIEQQE